MFIDNLYISSYTFSDFDNNYTKPINVFTSSYIDDKRRKEKSSGRLQMTSLIFIIITEIVLVWKSNYIAFVVVFFAMSKSILFISSDYKTTLMRIVISILIFVLLHTYLNKLLTLGMQQSVSIACFLSVATQYHWQFKTEYNFCSSVIDGKRPIIFTLIADYIFVKLLLGEFRLYSLLFSFSNYLCWFTTTPSLKL